MSRVGGQVGEKKLALGDDLGHPHERRAYIWGIAGD